MHWRHYGAGHHGPFEGRGCEGRVFGFSPREFGRGPMGGRGPFGGHGPGGGRGPAGGRGFGDGFGGDGRFGRSRMFGSGDLRLVLLALVAEKPSHGYELIRAIEAKFGGAYAPSPGAVYPTLTLLEEQDLIRSEVREGGKKVYEITPEGRAHLAENEAAVQGVMARMEMTAQAVAGEGAHETLHEAMRTLRHALRMQRRWDPEEVERVRGIIDRAAREIVFASEPPKGD